MKENECYGSMFPDLSRLEYNKPIEGRVFSVLVKSVGIGVQSRAIRVKTDEWRKCVTCESYHDCYDLSMAKLLLYGAL
jgi:hypothetical protein